MTPKHRPVADRQKSLDPAPAPAHFTLAGVRLMYEAGGGKEFHCTITGYRRTRIFEFPRIAFGPTDDSIHHGIYDSPSILAHVSTSLVNYFESAYLSNHYAISPSLRHNISENSEKIKAQNKNSTPVFLVIEEFNDLTPTAMVSGECSISDEVVILDGEYILILIGGKEGEQFITAWATGDGVWPGLPNNQQIVNMILAGVRVGQQTPDPIRKHLDQEGLVTDDGRFVVIMRPTMSMRGSTATPMDAKAFKDRASELRTGIAAIEQDISVPHMALLVNAMYRDEYKDDAYQRLHYLQLWQSLTEAGRKVLGYQGKGIKSDKNVIAGSKTLLELTEYRHDIAHWWTDTIDENYLADLQRTVNELTRRKYF